jgi:hypothetical protein
MSNQDFGRLIRDVEQLKGALQAALERIAALESVKVQKGPVPALLSSMIPAEVIDKVDKRRKEWRDKRQKER